ncbi:PucR family transcriptional regulator [Saccharopolyspora sp. CA-218241]|uniref:PucR family transcriptional regulator n=1 Tax=Saccharopolyspora sp. CA-218241 TaxID=3240027 RepID=UPI003D98047C
MRVLLSDLLSDQELGLVPLTGADRMDRPVRGVYITDLLDPRRYLAGGELVLSGLVWHTGPADSEAFVAALADARVAGLAAGTARLGRAPDDLVAACRRYDVPVFEVPLAVSFNTLAERVQRRAAPRRELVSAVASGADLDGVLRLAAAECSADCWVLSSVGRVVAGTAELPEEARRAALRALAAGPPPAAVPTGHALWPVASVGGPPAARWSVLVRGDLDRWDAEQEAVATDLGTAVALVRGRVDEARRIAGRSVEAALRRLREGTSTPAEVAAGLETAGLPVDEPVRAAVLDAGDAAASTAVLRELAAATGLASVCAATGSTATALFVDDAAHLDGLADRLRRLLADAEPALGADALAVGLSDAGPASGLRGALEEAGHAHRLAAARTGPGRAVLVGAGELASHEVLLATVPDELRGSYRQRVLGPLVDYDRAHHTELVRTLRVFLDCSGSWSRCAQRLHLHVNTLRYRIRRIEEICDRDLTGFAARVDVYLALRLDDHAPR